jgi:hypothetical protein
MPPIFVFFMLILLINPISGSNHHFEPLNNSVLYFSGCSKGSNAEKYVDALRENILKIAAYFKSYKIVLYTDSVAKTIFSNAFKDNRDNVFFIDEPANPAYKQTMRTSRLGTGRNKIVN